LEVQPVDPDVNFHSLSFGYFFSRRPTRRRRRHLQTVQTKA